MRIPLPVGLAAAATLVAASIAPATAAVLHPGFMPQPPAFQRNIIPQTLTRAEVKQLHPNVLPKQVYEKARQWAAKHPVKVFPNKHKAPSSWLMDDAGYIWGLKGGNIVTYLTDCSGAEGGVVDHAGNLVVACTNTSTVNVYHAGNYTGPADVVLDDTTGYYPAGAFEDSHGNIYATNLYGFVCTTNSCTFEPGNIVEWNAGSGTGSAPSNVITDSNMYEVYFGDVDGSGNCYIDGFNNSDVAQVDELPGCTSGAGTNLNILLEFPGGVYVMSPTASKSRLSIIDQGYYGSGQDLLYQFKMPVKVKKNGPKPKVTAYPPQNYEYSCDPVAGGYNAKEKSISIGDAGCRANFIGQPSQNTWSTILNINFSIPIDGAFIPSDK